MAVLDDIESTLVKLSKLSRLTRAGFSLYRAAEMHCDAGKRLLDLDFEVPSAFVSTLTALMSAVERWSEITKEEFGDNVDLS